MKFKISCVLHVKENIHGESMKFKISCVLHVKENIHGESMKFKISCVLHVKAINTKNDSFIFQEPATLLHINPLILLSREWHRISSFMCLENSP
jgi:hypothetical protein